MKREAKAMGLRAVQVEAAPGLSVTVFERAETDRVIEVETLRFDFHSVDPLPAADRVVLADVLYETTLARSAARRVAEAVRLGARVLVVDPGRFGRAEFLREMARHGIEATFRDVRVRLPGERLESKVGLAWIAAPPAAPAG